jgi:hypothetical protein
MRRGSARSSLGAPSTESLRYMTWCFEGGGRLVAAFSGRGPRSRAQLVLTNSPPFDTRGIRTGSSARFARRALKRERRLARVRGVSVIGVREKRRQLLVGLQRGRVAYVAVAQRKLGRRSVVRLLRGVR